MISNAPNFCIVLIFYSSLLCDPGLGWGKGGGGGYLEYISDGEVQRPFWGL